MAFKLPIFSAVYTPFPLTAGVDGDVSFGVPQLLGPVLTVVLAMVAVSIFTQVCRLPKNEIILKGTSFFRRQRWSQLLPVLQEEKKLS